MSTTNKKKSTVIIIIAATLIIAIAALTFWISGISASSDEIFAAHFRPLPVPETLIRDSDNTSFQRGVQAYTARDYETAVRNFRQSDEEADFSRFYAGVSLMALEKFRQALEFFEEAENSLPKAHPLREEITWYKALCYLKTDRQVEMKALLDDIIESEGMRSFQANAILDLTRD